LNYPSDLVPVERFLEEYRACAGSNPYVLKNNKNRTFFESSGITAQQINDILNIHLKSEHCYAGPEMDADHTRPAGAVYKFKYPWNEYTIYIKLKVPNDEKLRLKATICFSFHEDKDI